MKKKKDEMSMQAGKLVSKRKVSVEIVGFTVDTKLLEVIQQILVFASL